MEGHHFAAEQTARSLAPRESGVYPPVERLTPREQEVLGLVAQAARTREIAQNLGISHRTVECHLARVYGKLGVRGRMEAMLWTVRQGGPWKPL